MLIRTDAGLYCPEGDFHVDPWRPVARAVITHAHGDHLAAGSAAYLAADAGRTLLAGRLPDGASIDTMQYGEPRRVGGVSVSFHPAGHILGSAQVRIERGGDVWVVSGDYKLAADPTCAPFEPIRCRTFITESTFGLPIYRWDAPARTIAAIAAWWEDNRASGHCSVIYAYAAGKSQRVLAGLAAHYGTALPGPVYCHGAVERLNAAYRAAGVALPATAPVATAPRDTRWQEALVLAPPSARGSRWPQRFVPSRSAFASGWMAIRGTRRRANYDRGFALSDHADWPALNDAIAATGAEQVWVTHGHRDELVRWLLERGVAATAVETEYVGEAGADPVSTPDLATPEP